MNIFMHKTFLEFGIFSPDRFLGVILLVKVMKLLETLDTHFQIAIPEICMGLKNPELCVLVPISTNTYQHGVVSLSNYLPIS